MSHPIAILSFRRRHLGRRVMQETPFENPTSSEGTSGVRIRPLPAKPHPHQRSDCHLPRVAPLPHEPGWRILPKGGHWRVRGPHPLGAEVWGRKKGGIRERFDDPGRRPSTPRVAVFTIELTEGIDPRVRPDPKRNRLRREERLRGAPERLERLQSHTCRCKKGRRNRSRPRRGPGKKQTIMARVPKRKRTPARPRICWPRLGHPASTSQRAEPVPSSSR